MSCRALVAERVARLLSSLTPQLAELTKKGGEFIASGELVAFPTETVYGLGANALDSTAVAKIYEAKGRPSDNPLILHVASVEMAESLVHWSERAELLASKFWPGALSLVLPARDIVPSKTRGGLATAAVRLPANAIALSLIENSALPIAAPSANISGRPSPTEARVVAEEMGDKIPLVIDGGQTVFGVESTVLDITTEKAVLLRAGGVSKEEIEEVIGEKVFLPQTENEVKRSPGTRYRHYAPLVPLFLVEQGSEIAEAKKWFWIGTKKAKFSLSKPLAQKLCLDYNVYARELFKTLREAEAKGAEVIYAELPSETGIGRALKDRLTRAASKEK